MEPVSLHDNDEEMPIRRCCETNGDRYELIDRLMDDMGFGKFHIILFMVASLAFFVEAAEMGALTILYPVFISIWNVEQSDLSIIGSFTGIGMIAGTGFFGRLADRIGRKIVYQVSLFLCVLFGFLSSFATNVLTFALIRMALGFAYGGNIVSATTLLLENAPSKYRGLLSGLLQFAFAFGNLFVIGLSWALMDSLGWAWIIRILSLIGIPALACLFFIPGSARFYISHHEYDKAYDEMIRICRANDFIVPSYFSRENFVGTNNKEIIQQRNFCMDLVYIFTNVEQRKTIIPLFSVWILFAFGHGLSSFLPVEISVYTGIENIQYKVGLGISIGAICGACVVAAISTFLRRLVELRLGLSMLASAVVSLSFLADNIWLLELALILMSTGAALCFHVLYTYTPEVFPTSIRVTAFSICQIGNRIAPVFSPFVVTSLATRSFELCTMVFSFIFLCAIAASLFLTKETFNQKLVEETSGEQNMDHELQVASASRRLHRQSSDISIELTEELARIEEVNVI